jgi:hypothetical protein
VLYSHQRRTGSGRAGRFPRQGSAKLGGFPRAESGPGPLLP